MNYTPVFAVLIEHFFLRILIQNRPSVNFYIFIMESAWDIGLCQLLIQHKMHTSQKDPKTWYGWLEQKVLLLILILFFNAKRRSKWLS